MPPTVYTLSSRWAGGFVVMEDRRMAWKPQFPPVPPHPAQAFDFRVAELLAGARPVGHLLVIAEPYARETGRLWWKTLSDPHVTLEFWSSIRGEFDDGFLADDKNVDAEVTGLQRGEWRTFDKEPTTYSLRWLDPRKGTRSVSRGVRTRSRRGTATSETTSLTGR